QAGAEGPQHAEQGWRPSPAEAAEFLVSLALHAQVEADSKCFLWCVAQLAGEADVAASGAPSGAFAVLAGPAAVTARTPGWKRSVDRELRETLLQTITDSWRRGWQPAELVRHVERQFGSRHARLTTDAVAAEMRSYAAATVDDRWAAQLAALG